jgi:hypothetical protein
MPIIIVYGGLVTTLFVPKSVTVQVTVFVPTVLYVTVTLLGTGLVNTGKSVPDQI